MLSGSKAMKITVKTIRDKKKKKERITVLTAYDFPFARILDEQEMDVILVGDSLGMVVLGYESTVPVTMRHMLHHTQAVTRAVKKSLVVADMPFGSYAAPDKSVRNALRLIKEAGADAVKVEGGKTVEAQIRKMIGSGIAVMGHLGMTPQTAGQLGGYRVQGRIKQQADALMRDALLLDRLGVFAIVLECVPAALARKITRVVKCPTIGIGAGPSTDGQVLVLYDMLGVKSSVKPRFVRAYANLERTVKKAVRHYKEDVLGGKFPSKEESF